MLRVARLLVFAASACLAREAPPGADGPRPPFSAPADFARNACVAGALAPLQPLPEGFWHIDFHLDGFAPFPASLRIRSGETLFNGRPATLRLTNDDLFVRVEYRSRDQNIAWSVDACAAASPTALRGMAARCVDNANCRVGPFSAYRIARRIGEAEALGLTKVAEVGFTGSITANVRVKGNIAYLARFGDGLRIVDLSSPAAPVHLGHVAPQEANLGEIYNDVKLYKDYALLASSRFGLVVVDVRTPSAPRLVRTFPPRPPSVSRINVHSIFVEGDRAYLAEITIAGMRIANLTNPEDPVDEGTFVLPETASSFDSFVHDLTVYGGIAWLNYWGSGFVAVDLGARPLGAAGRYTYERMTSHASWVTEIGGRRYALHGDEDFGAHLRILDVTAPTDPAWMTVVGEYVTRPEVSIHNIMAVGARAYVAYYQDGLRVLDLSDPSHPRLVGYYNTWDPARHPGTSFYEGAIGLDVDPARRRVYIADTDRGLIVLEERF
jgi:hypothetical protein